MSFVLISICCPCFPDGFVFEDQKLDVTVVRFCARVPFQQCLVAFRFNGFTYIYIYFAQVPLLKYLPTLSCMTSCRITVAIIRRNSRYKKIFENSVAMILFHYFLTTVFWPSHGMSSQWPAPAGVMLDERA